MKRMFLVTMFVLIAFAGMASAQSYEGGTSANAIVGSVTSVLISDNPQQYLSAPTIFPNVMPNLQNGKVGDVTALIPKFAVKGLIPLDLAKDRVKKVLDVSDGNMFSRIRIDEIEEQLIAKVANLVSDKDVKADKIRFQVQYKDSVHTAGIGGGAAGSLSGALGDNGASGTLAILPGMHRSTADPMYIIKFYEIE